MAPRNRTKDTQDLPPNLYKSGEYYRYKKPDSGKYVGLGTDKTKAILAAKQANALLMHKTDFVKKIMGDESNTWAGLVKRYMAERQWQENKKASTVKEENYRLQHIVDGIGKIELIHTTQRLVSNFLSNNFEGNSYTKHRGVMIKLFAFGIASGMFPDGYSNLALATLPAQVEKKTRGKLTLEQYTAIREQADDWLKVAMDFSLITLQRRGDVVLAKYSDIESGELRVIQQKTEKHGERAYLRIKIGNDLSAVITRSRQVQPVCPFIVHRQAERNGNTFEGQEHWAQVRDQYLTKAFNKARDKTGIFADWKKGEAPTFHEIRGLGGALYLQQGYSKEYVNLLMGHTTQRMTDSYTDQHMPWTECAAELKL